MAWAYVQGAATIANYVSGTGLAYPSNVTAGNTLILVFLHNYFGCPVAVADTQGNTYTKVVDRQRPSTFGEYISVWTGVANATGANTVTPTYSCGAGTFGYITEYSGLTVSPFDVFASATNSVNPCLAGAVTTTAANDLVISCFTANFGESFSALSGTRRLTTAGGTQSTLQDQNQVAAGSVTPSATAFAVTGTYQVRGWTIAFKQAGGATTNSNFFTFF